MNRFAFNNRGVALLITLTIVTLMIAVALELHQKARATVISNSVVRDRAYLSEMAFSGIQAAMAVLVKDKMESTIDTVQEDWADPEKIKEMLSDFTFDDGTLTVDIEDELGKIQVNSLVSGPGGRVFNESQRSVWDRCLMWLKEQHDDTAVDIDPTTIINSMKDWMDSGDDDATTGLTGAESDFYQDLNPAYSCRNDPIMHRGELLQIKGISSVLFYGTKGIPGLSSFVTVYDNGEKIETSPGAYTNGKININTASLPVLVSLMPLENPEAAQLILEYRQERDGDNYVNDISSPTWYKEIPGVGDIDIDSTIVTTSSDLYGITAIADVGARKMAIRAVVRREQQKKTGKWICRILSLSTN